MKNTRIATLGLAALFLLIVSVCPGLPQPAEAAEPMTVEGTWDTGSGKHTIRRKSSGEYEVIWANGRRDIYSGSPTEIRQEIPQTFEELKKGDTITPDSVVGEAAAAGVHITLCFKLSQDGHTLQFLQDKVSIEFDRKAGHLAGKGIYLTPEPPFTLTRVPETTGVGSSASIGANTAIALPQKNQTLQLQMEAHRLNEQGAQYAKDKQWKQAAEAFKAALEKSPDDQTIRSNYELAISHLAEGAKEVAKEPDEEQVSKPALKPKPAPRRRQPEAPRPPELPAGGALSD